MSKLSLWRTIYFVSVFCAVAAIGLTAEASTSFKTLHNFDFSIDGADPEAGLVQGADGNFYGTTYEGGTHGDGTVFKITPGGTLTVLHSFDGTDGFETQSGLVLATDGNFYGTTRLGGAHGDGTVFKITPAGTFTTLHSFNGTDGAEVIAGLGASH
jgi:uncharacterized repeat protein (TIGR03803 family)